MLYQALRGDALPGLAGGFHVQRDGWVWAGGVHWHWAFKPVVAQCVSRMLGSIPAQNPMTMPSCRLDGRWGQRSFPYTNTQILAPRTLLHPLHHDHQPPSLWLFAPSLFCLCAPSWPPLLTFMWLDLSYT